MTLELTETLLSSTITEALDDPAALRTMLDASENHNELLQESVADLELAAEDRGWQSTAYAMEHEFSRQGLADLVRNCRIMVIASPLIKRGVQLRIGYVWGQGVTVQARAGAEDDGTQDVNAVVQAWWDDPSNQGSVTGSAAQEELERTAATTGNVFLCSFTDPVTGHVQVRSAPFDEIVDVIRNPQDRDEPWFYIREYETTVVRAFQPAGGQLTTRTRLARVKVFHPALGYRPVSRPRSIDGAEVLWDAPILHVAVNRPAGWKWGVPDVYAALPWARAYDGFLTDWARLVKALSRFAWRLTGDRSSKAKAAAARVGRAIGATPGVAPVPGIGANTGAVGGVAAMGPGSNLEAIPKSGATIDSQSGKPLAAMVAAGLGVSVVDLLADPGTTGARAVAETLDKPVMLEMTMRRNMWGAVLQTLTGYVIDQAVKAPRGPLTGTVRRDPGTGREVVTLAGNTERTVTVDWPDLNELDPVKLITAIVAAGDFIPEVETVRLLLHALRVKDVDEVMAPHLDDTGQWVRPDATAGQAAVDAFRQGTDPATVLDPSAPTTAP